MAWWRTEQNILIWIPNRVPQFGSLKEYPLSLSLSHSFALSLSLSLFLSHILSFSVSLSLSPSLQKCKSNIVLVYMYLFNDYSNHWNNLAEWVGKEKWRNRGYFEGRCRSFPQHNQNSFIRMWGGRQGTITKCINHYYQI